MARDGSGNYSRIYNWVTDLGNAIPITASRHDAEDDSIATALTNSLDRSSGGGGDILRNVGMSNNKFTSLGSGSALTDSINLDDVQSGKILFFGTTSGTSTVYTLAPSPSINAYDTGMVFWFKVNTDSGATPTLNISAKGAKNMKKFNAITGAKLSIKALDLQTGIFYLGYYDGTDVMIINPATIPVVSVEKTLNIQEQTATISSDTITAAGSNMVLSLQGGVDDDLATVNGLSEGDLLEISTDGVGDLTIKHSTGNILTSTNLDVVLVNANDRWVGRYDGTNLVEISRALENDFRTGSGYKYEPNNRLTQFGTYGGGSHAPTITFGIAFDSIDTVICTGKNPAINISVTSKTTTNFVGDQTDATPSDVSTSFEWEATGIKAQ